ncbi:MAG: hypothetical protein HY901_17380 [Deltaproteobacteria bacterium]|nr:hypothetical protein [Deltaproteobacteria bacterium]
MRSLMSWSVALLVAAAGCGDPEEGDYCEYSWPRCKDDHTALFCDTNVYRALSCPGAKGCRADTVSGQHVMACDITGTVAGDQCTSDYMGFVICRSAYAAIRCNGITWANLECPEGTCEDGTFKVGGMSSRGSCE